MNSGRVSRARRNGPVWSLGLLALVALGGCLRDETLSGHGAADVVWVLASIDEQPGGGVTVRFPQKGRIEGQAQCNAFSGRQNAPYPWFEARNIVTTRRACDGLADEARFLAALQQMQLVEVAGPILILSTEDGREMVFTTAE